MAKQKDLDKIVKEVEKCKSDFVYFAENYLHIVDKNDKLIKLRLNKAQSEIHADLDQTSYLKILKARQLGSSTYIAARFFWKALFNINTRVVVIAHTHEAVKSIYSIYQRFYTHLPKWLKIQTEKASANELSFVTGSSIKIGTANSQNFRGSTFSCIHASEAAYWNDMNNTIQSLFQTATNNPEIIVETTPNGLNDFYTFWKDSNGYKQTFLSWTDHTAYQQKEANKGWKLSEIEKEYIAEHGLNDYQFNWFQKTLRTRCSNNIHTFKTEYPARPEDAFIASGAFVFPTLAKDLLDAPEKMGWQLFSPPNKYASYILGVDTASGSPNGDYSAACLIDVTDKENYKLIGTFYDRLTLKEYAKEIENILTKYEALVVCERNSYGQAIIEHLRSAEYPYLYTETKFDKLSKTFTERFGFYTSAHSRPVLMAKLIDTVTSNKIEIKCSRLKYEFLHFIYSDKGKAEAEAGYHDDLIMALGLALMGLEQSFHYEHERMQQQKPATLRDKINFEIAHGTTLETIPDNYWADESPLERFIADWNQ